MAVTLNVRPRSAQGKNSVRKLRQAGIVPAVVYGHGDETRLIEIALNELQRLLANAPANTLIDLRDESGPATQALIREVQHHPVKPQILHVDFLLVHAGEVVRLSVPVRLHGTPVGVREGGGTLQESMHEIEVECLPKDIPEGIDLDVAGLAIGESIHVSDVAIQGVTILNDPDLVIASVTAPTTEALPELGEADEGGGEPERIGRPEGDAEE